MATTTAPAANQVLKLDLIKITGELMPAGKPNFLQVINFPKITDLVTQKGEATILLALSIMVRNFCASLNVSRNMNEDQILDAANMLLEECGNFRLEDYLMMFEMAKRGQLVKIYERIDIAIITEIADMFFEKRRRAAENHEQETTGMLDSLGPVDRQKDSLTPDEMKVEKLINNFGTHFVDMKENFRPDHEKKQADDGKGNG